MHFLTLNKAFLAVASLSTSLWQDLSFNLKGAKDAEHVARWLAGKWQQLGALRIRAPSQQMVLMIDWTFERQLHLLLGSLSCTTVHTLALSGLKHLEVNSWLANLPHLRSLDVEAQHITVGPGLSLATRLSDLQLESDSGSIHFPPGCLPTSLRSLHVDRAHINAADPLATGPLPRLERLGLITHGTVQQVQSGCGCGWECSVCLCIPTLLKRCVQIMRSGGFLCNEHSGHTSSAFPLPTPPCSVPWMP